MQEEVKGCRSAAPPAMLALHALWFRQIPHAGANASESTSAPDDLTIGPYFTALTITGCAARDLVQRLT